MAGRSWRCSACALEFTADEPRCPQCLKQSTVLPPDAPGAPRAKRLRRPGERHVEVNTIMQIVLAVAHVLFTLSAAINLALTISGAGDPGQPLAGIYESPSNATEYTASIVTFAWIGLWSAVGVIWTPLNAWALSRRRPWARASTIAYYVASLLGCCCLPVGAYGIWSMAKKDVGEFLQGRGEGPAA